jgi:hypothetical protein
MSEFEKNIENALKDMGVNFVDFPPEEGTTELQPQPTDSVSTITEPTPEEVGSSFNNSVQPQAVSEPAPATDSSEDMSDEEFESMFVSHLSERLGLQLNSFDDLSLYLTGNDVAATIDERVKVIADFVAETGRSPQDWFNYQSFNPSEMDDL